MTEPNELTVERALELERWIDATSQEIAIVNPSDTEGDAELLRHRYESAYRRLTTALSYLAEQQATIEELRAEIDGYKRALAAQRERQRRSPPLPPRW